MDMIIFLRLSIFAHQTWEGLHGVQDYYFSDHAVVITCISGDIDDVIILQVRD